jgi:hypothetical protein
VTVTGKLATADADLAAAALLVAALLDAAALPGGAEVVLLADVPQPARTAAHAAAVPRAAVILRGGLIEGYFLPDGREGRRGRWRALARTAAAGTDRPSHEG